VFSLTTVCNASQFLLLMKHSGKQNHKMASRHLIKSICWLLKVNLNSSKNFDLICSLLNSHAVFYLREVVHALRWKHRNVRLIPAVNELACSLANSGHDLSWGWFGAEHLRFIKYKIRNHKQSVLLGFCTLRRKGSI